MAGGSISPPGVEVIQQFVTTTPTSIAPALPTVLVGAAFQVVDAFDDLGNPQQEAYAGTYRNAQGVIAYNLPSLVEQTSLVGFEDDVRVFLVYGTETVELGSVADEVSILSEGSGAYTQSTKKLVDGAQLFTQIGVEAGDVVRLTWRDEVLDVAVVSVDSDTELTLAASALTENLAGVSYDVVRNPAQFVFNATVQANVEYGTAADYLRVTAALLKADGVTPGEFLGAAGDVLSLSIVPSEKLLSGTLGAIGDAIFEDTGGGDFLTSVGPRGAVSGTPFYAQVGANGAGQVLREVLAVVDNDILIIESGEGTVTAQNWAVGSELVSGAAGETATDTSFVDATATFTTSIPNTAGTPDDVTYVEIVGAGVYQVSAVTNNTTLVLSTATAATATGQDYTIISIVASGTGDGETKATTVFAQADVMDFADLSDDGSESINVGGTAASALTVVDSNLVTVSGLSSGSLLSWSAVQTATPLTLTWDSAGKEIVVQVARVAGLSGSTLAEIEAAINDDSAPGYNPAVADRVEAVLGGSVGDGATLLTEALLADGYSAQFDGGSGEEQLLLDADLLSSATPTAQVYVSYKGLRVGVSPQAVNASLLDIPDQATREALLGAATAENPLSLAVYFALLNSPQRPVKALGVSSVSATKPDGTFEAYAEAFTFLESHSVHLVIPLTVDPTVAGALQLHVDAMSAPAAKSTRTGFFNTPLPTHSPALLRASGSDGNTGVVVGQATAEFSASVDFAAQGVVAGDLLVVGSLAAVANSPAVVNGTLGPLYGVVVTAVKPSDPFVLQFDGTESGISVNWNNLVDVGFAVYKAGNAITSPADQAEAIARVGESFVNRRLFHHWPDQITADVGGQASVLPGYYATACWGGKANATRADAGFSNTSIVGPTGVRHSNGYFSRGQLDRMAGGGTWITIQESPGAPLKCRHQVSTDTSSIEKLEWSITRVVDYTAEYLSKALNKQTGKFNITQSYLDSLASSVQGLLAALVESGMLVDAKLISLGVNSVRADKIDIIIAIDVPYPANYIEVTLQV